jgi:L-rhamnose isomerase/sugar isomerase
VYTAWYRLDELVWLYLVEYDRFYQSGVTHKLATMTAPLPSEQIAQHNRARQGAVREDYDALGRSLARRGISIDAIAAQVADFSVALPSWGLGTGGTRFARFPIPGEPANLHEKLADAAVVQQLCRVTPRLSLHFPWDKVDDPRALRQEAAALGLSFDAVNSNTFQDQPGQAHTYKYGSLSAADPEARDLAVAHNIACIRLGEKLGSTALTVWVGDGSNYPGQQNLTAALDRYLESAKQIYAALPANWQMLVEHKLYEPAFYATVIADWGTSFIVAQQLGDKARCLVDMGHHAPGTNIEQIVARLARFGKLGGLHFNDSKYGDDDLDSGSVNPHQLFLVFHELVQARDARPSYMIDQSHNVTDPIESLLTSAEAIAGSYARALLVDQAALAALQAGDDVIEARRVLRRAYETDVAPILAVARMAAGGAADPVAAYRESGWRGRKAAERRPAKAGSGIV